MKNPYEIRTEMLFLAKEYLDKQYQSNVDLYVASCDLGSAVLTDYPALYSFEQIEDMAKRFYRFVETK
jgi:hypothetical protein